MHVHKVKYRTYLSSNVSCRDKVYFQIAIPKRYIYTRSDLYKSTLELEGNDRREGTNSSKC